MRWIKKKKKKIPAGGPGLFRGRTMDVPGIPELTVLSSSAFSLVRGGEQAAHSKELGRSSELRT